MKINACRLGEAMAQLRELQIQRMEPEFYSILLRDPEYQRLKRRARDLALKRARLAEGGTTHQIRLTTNAWARVADAQDKRETFLKNKCKKGWVVICLGSLIDAQIRAGLAVTSEIEAKQRATVLNGELKAGDHGGYLAIKWADLKLR